MNKKRSVRIPITDTMLKELRQKAQNDAIDVSNATRLMWRDWINGNIRIGAETCHARTGTEG